MNIKFLLGLTLLMTTVAAHESKIKIQGHRGSRGTHRENTLLAFVEAIEAHATGVELDLQVSKDGVVVICHEYTTDPSLLTHSDGAPLKERKLIRDCLLSELKELDYGYATHPRFAHQQGGPGTKIPTLEELFRMLQDRQDLYAQSLLINLELKREPMHPEWSIDPTLFVDKVVSLVEQFGFEERVYYSSFDPLLLEKLHIRAPKAILGYIINSADFNSLFPNDVLIKRAHELGVTIISPEYTALDQDAVQNMCNAGLRVVPWTVNDPQSWKKSIDMGIQEIITDYPRELKKFIH